MGDHIDVFISSTSQDLSEYRLQVERQILKMNLHPIGMENFNPTAAGAVQKCYDELQEAEMFIGIYAYRYGFRPAKGVRYSAGECDGETSITQMEYEWAVEKGIPLLLFLVDEGVTWPSEMKEGGPRLEAFKAHLKNTHVVGFFKSPDDLAARVSAAIYDALPQVKRPEQQIGDWRVLKPPLLLRQFVGRQNDIETIQKSLANGGRVVIQGAGGMGKTTLVQHLGHTLNYPGGVLWAYLGPSSTPLPFIWKDWKEVTPEGRAASAQDIQPADIKRWLEQSPGQLLAIIDDVWDKKALAALLDALPESAHVLVTTRDAELAGGRAGKRYELHHLLPDDALSLLQNRLPDAPADLLQKTAALLENHALALHLVTAYIEQNSIHDLPRLIERLERHRGGQNPFKELQLGESRDENLEVALFLSYDALDTDHQMAFRQLGIIPAGLDFSMEMALGVWGVDTDDPDALEAAEDRLSRLVRAGMVERTETGRYDLHMLYHDYALALLLRQAEETLPRARYQTEVFKIAEKFENLPPEKWREDIEPDFGHIHERGNALVQAVESWLKAQNAPPLTQFAQPQPLDLTLEKEADILQAAFDFASAGIKAYVSLRSIGEEGRRWLEIGLLAARTLGSRIAESLFLNELGLWLSNRGYKRAALAYYEANLIIDRELGNKKGEATTLNNLGMIYAHIGEQQKALDYFQQARPLHRAVGNRSGEATTLNNIGGVYADLGEQQKALDYFQQALSLLRRTVGNRSGEATTLTNIGGVYADLGEQQKALDYYQQALPLRRAVGDRRGEAATLTNIGTVYDDLGEKAQALDYFQLALPLMKAVGDRSGEATTLNNVGRVYDDLGEKAQALDYFQQALPIYRAVGDRNGEATILSNMGLVYQKLGENQKALSYYQQALPLRRAVEDRYGEANTLYNMSFLVDTAQAIEYVTRARDLLRAVQSPHVAYAESRLVELLGN